MGVVSDFIEYIEKRNNIQSNICEVIRDINDFTGNGDYIPDDEEIDYLANRLYSLTQELLAHHINT